jgi:hypothetical protein
MEQPIPKRGREKDTNKTPGFIVNLTVIGLDLPVLKTHRSYDRLCPCHYFSHLLNLLSIAQGVGNRLAFGDAADAPLHERLSALDFLRRRFFLTP